MLWLGIAWGSAWQQDAGTARVGFTVQRLTTRHQFASGEASGLLGPRCPSPVQRGQRAPYDCTTGGRFTNLSAAVSSSVGVHRFLTIDAWLPVVLAAKFEDDLGETLARGLGDLRFGVRSGARVGPVALALGLHAKAPTGPAGLVDRDVPLGDAQWDLVPTVRFGISLHPWGWLEMHQGFVVRLRSQRSGIDPGEEWTGNLGGGFQPVPWGGLQVRAEWILALPDTDGFGLSHPGRRLLQLRAGPFVRSGPWWLQTGLAIPVAGERWPSAPSWEISASWTGPERAE